MQPGDGTAAKRPTSKEHFKAKRLGQDATSREILRLRVRRAVAAASTEAKFFALLEATGVTVRLKQPFRRRARLQLLPPCSPRRKQPDTT